MEVPIRIWPLFGTDDLMPASYSSYASVALEIAVDKILDYGVPPDWQVSPGMRVEVPVRGHSQYGYIVEVKPTCAYSPVQPLRRLVSSDALITKDLLQLALWMARYYCCSLRQVFKVMLPSSLRREIKEKQQLYVMRAKTKEELRQLCMDIREKKPAQAEVLEVMLQVRRGILLTELLEETGGTRSPVETLASKGYLLIEPVKIDRSPLVNEEYFPTKPKKLNEEQAAALACIRKTIDAQTFGVHLLHGVTGSGKTEVYLQAIQAALDLGRGVIMLVPEISLTTQTIERFRSRFDDKIAILHHRLSHGERYDEWHRLYSGKASIVIGARSSVFSPLPNLGLIIVDEEHEGSYKQGEEMPCYHARDVAVMRGKMCQAAVILGSATPSLESYHNALTGKYTLSKLGQRADAAQIPAFKIVDMKRAYEKAGGYTNFSEELLNEIQKRTERGEQTILFLNRRGYHTILQCTGCGEAVKCKHCDVTLTFHYNEKTLACHLCGYAHTPPPQTCPGCSASQPMKFKGVGTENIERSLHAIFPSIRTIRLDADTTKHKGSQQKMLRDFGSGKADVLIGTQMIAKGLHFPEVTLVGILNSDAGLHIPDFRAAETAFQLMTQVAGRAGRGLLPGLVIFQTSMPEHGTIQLAAQQQFEPFFREEIESRQAFGYPPFCQMAKFAFTGKDLLIVRQAAEVFHAFLSRQLPATYLLNPPIPAGHAKVKDKFRYQFLVRGPAIQPISQVMEKLTDTLKKELLGNQVQLHVDINPLSTFF